MHHWNVVLVKKYTYPMPTPVEFSVEAESFQDACSIIFKKFDDEYKEDKWKIRSIYWLNPQSIKKEE